VSACGHDIKTPPGNIRQLSMGSWIASESSHLENVVVTIHFRRKTAVGSKLAARVDSPTTMMCSSMPGRLSQVRRSSVQVGFHRRKVQVSMQGPDTKAKEETLLWLP
jgi:hypothetical protein